jgi:SpoVK/Ycf46/Vps4 family AAA+-type ATPase
MTEDVSRRPEFAERIIEKYRSSQSNVFLAYGNTRDIYSVSLDRYVPLVGFFAEALVRPNRPDLPRIAIVYDPAEGIKFLNPVDRSLVAGVVGPARLERILSASRGDTLTACRELRELTRTDVMVPMPGEYGRKMRKDFAIIMRYGEAIAPASRGDAMPDSDRLPVITLENWFSDNAFVASRDIVFLISETLTGINERIVDLPYVATIKIDRPNEEERRKFIEFLIREEQARISGPVSHIVHSSAGLTLLSLRQIVRQALFRGQDVTSDLVLEKTKEILEKELEGHIEFPRLTYGFEKVIGASRLIKKLNELKDCLRADDPELMPVGILVPGANGVGKTYIFKAFAKECGWVAVVLKNIRGPYVGQTEQNWERIRSVLEALGSVMVLYDEADTEIGGRGSDTHDVDRRLFGNILKMMSDSANRGRIVWIIITARPDRLEPDIKRSGRAGEHLPVFDNEGPEKDAFRKHVLNQADVDLEEFSPDQAASFLELTATYYPADFDQLLTELKRRRSVEGILTPEMVLDEARDFLPSDIARQREYQELLAVLECTSRELLPSRYAELPREIVQQRVAEIRTMMGHA